MGSGQLGSQSYCFLSLTQLGSQSYCFLSLIVLFLLAMSHSEEAGKNDSLYVVVLRFI